MPTSPETDFTGFMISVGRRDQPITPAQIEDFGLCVPHASAVMGCLIQLAGTLPLYFPLDIGT